MAGLLNFFGGNDGYSPAGPMDNSDRLFTGSLGLLQLGNILGRQPRYSTNIADVTRPDDSGLRNTLALSEMMRQRSGDKIRAADFAQRQKMNALTMADMERKRRGETELGDAVSSAFAPKQSYQGANGLPMLPDAPGGSMQPQPGTQQYSDPMQSPAVRASMARNYPVQALTAFSKDDSPVSVAADAALVRPKSGEVVYSGQGKETSDEKNYLAAARGGFKGSFADYQMALRRAGQPNIQTTLDMKQPTAAANEIGKGQGELYNTIQKQGFNAPVAIGKYDRLQSLLNDAPQGALGPAEQRLREYGQSIGLNVGNAAPGQAARAISNELTLELRNPSGGAGMPGAMSDADREFLAQATPRLANTPEGNAKMIEYRKRLARREQDVAKLARDYKKKNGGNFDDGFFDELAAWSKENPLFPEAKSGPGGTPNSGFRILKVE
jgi:hypothetical protein